MPQNRFPGSAPPSGLSVRVFGHTVEWQAKFRDAMLSLCETRGVPGPYPDLVGAAALRAEGLLLIWPMAIGERPPLKGRVSRKGKRFLSDLPEAFRDLKLSLPDGVSIGVPVVPYQHGAHGPCLALQFSRASFLYRRSRASAIALQP